MAGELGAASTGAVIDLQLTAAVIFRFELDDAERHARSALDRQHPARPGQDPRHRAAVPRRDLRAAA